jgi:hypothetical protein
VIFEESWTRDDGKTVFVAPFEKKGDNPDHDTLAVPRVALHYLLRLGGFEPVEIHGAWLGDENRYADGCRRGDVHTVDEYNAGSGGTKT